MLKDYLFLALGNLKHRGIRSWLTMLGIFIGIAAVVSLISLGNGLESTITAQFAALSTDTLVIQNAETGFGPPGSTAVTKLTSHDLDLIKSVNGLEFVIPRLLRVARVDYNKISSFKFVASMPEDQKQIDAIYSSLNVKIESGKLLSSGDRGKIVLGHDYFKSNEFEKPIRVGSLLKIKGEEFEVMGFLKQASTFQVNLAILMMEEDMKKIISIGDEIDIIVARVSEEDEIEIIAKNIEEKLRKDRKEKIGEEDFSVQTPLQALSSVNTILTILNIIVSGIAAISLLIGSIGIANTMYTSVLERTKEIGIMKSVGAQNKDILLIFLIESGLLGLAGGIIGAAIGLGLAFLASSAANSFFGSNLLLVSISWPLLIVSVTGSFILGIVAGILPALQASRLKPVEALRK